MINLRYHLISITAVFLALGIGVLLGSSFIGDAAVDRIESNVSDAQDEVDATREENDRLRERVELLEERDATFAEQAVGELFTGRLAEVPVLVIAPDGLDSDSLDQLEGSLAGSAATFAGTLTLDDTLVVEDEDQARELDELLGLGAERPGDVAGAVTAALVDDLLGAAELVPGSGDSATGEPPTTSTSSTIPTTGPPITAEPGEATAPEIDPDELLTEPETVQELLDSGYLDYEPGSGFDADLLLQSPGYRIVVATGTGAGELDAALVQPLVRALVADGPAPVVLAAVVGTDGTADEIADARAELIAPYIDGPEVGSRISTVDNLEALPGVAATVLALEDLGAGRRGHYGVDDRASSMLPQAR